MDTYASIKNRLRHTVRLDRAIRFVWQAGSGWLICSSLLVGLQGALPLVFIYLGRYRHPFAAAAPGILVRIKYSRKMFLWQRERTPENRKAMYFNWILTGNIHAKEVRLFGIGDEISEQFSNVRQILRHEQLSITRHRAIADFFSQAIGTFAVFVALGAIAYRAVLGLITLGDMVMFFQAFQRGLTFLRNLLKNLADLYENNLFLSHLYEFLDVESRVKDPIEPQPTFFRILFNII